MATTDRTARAARAQREGRQRAQESAATKLLASTKAAETKRKMRPRPGQAETGTKTGQTVPPAERRTESARVAAQRKPTSAGKVDPVSAAPVRVEDAVHKMTLEHVQCRDFGHSWRPFTARWLAKFNSYESQLICNRCKTLRTRFLSRTGEQLSGGYDYADGYLVKGLGRLTGSDRDVIRLASIQAVLTPDTAEDD